FQSMGSRVRHSSRRINFACCSGSAPIRASSCASHWRNSEDVASDEMKRASALGNFMCPAHWETLARLLLEMPLEIAADRERDQHNGECNRDLHGVVEHGVAHDSSPFTGYISKWRARRH